MGVVKSIWIISLFPGLKEALRVGRGNLGTQSLCEGLHIQALSGQGQTARTALPERWKELGEERLGRESTRLGEQMLRERRRRGERRHPEEVDHQERSLKMPTWNSCE